MKPEDYNKRVLDELIAIRKNTDEILKRLAASGRAPSSGGATGGGGEIASDRDLDSERGDPSIRKDPPRWKGQSYVGYRYSETDPAYLDCLADFKDWQSQNPRAGADPKYTRYDRIDAGRARGWAVRLRNGWQSPAPAPGAGGGEWDGTGASGASDGDDGLPF